MPNLLGFEFNRKSKPTHIAQQTSRFEETPVPQVSHDNVKSADKIDVEEVSGVVLQIAIENIIPNPNQPRKMFDEKALYALAGSIQTHGILQPLTVRKLKSVNDDSPTVYELIAGERRLRAATILCMQTVPCVVVSATKQVSAELALIENLQREDLNFFEQGVAIFKLIDMYSYTQDEIAKKLSVSQSYIANKLRILKLAPEEQEVIIRENLTERHARSLIRIADIDDRKAALLTIIRRSMNVSATDKYIDKLLFAAKTAKQRNKLILKDIRLFMNSIDKAVDLATQSGINVKSEKVDRGEYIEFRMSIPKNK